MRCLPLSSGGQRQDCRIHGGIPVPPRLVETLDSFGYSAGTAVHVAVMERLGGSYAWADDLRQNASAKLLSTYLTDDEVRSWLSSLPVDAECLASVDWARDGLGVEIPFSVFMRYFDDLWYPSSDDVVVVFSDGAVLLIDHEERLSFAATWPPQQPPRGRSLSFRAQLCRDQ
jgi:hypothetical protein